MVLARLAEQWALPVVPYNTRYFAISAEHPMFQGSMPGPLLTEADLVIVIEADVPWIPGKEQPAAGARIAQIGEDPLYARYPMRSFPSDLTITASALVGAGGAGTGAGRSQRATCRGAAGAAEQAVGGVACRMARRGGTGGARQQEHSGLAESLPARSG